MSTQQSATPQPSSITALPIDVFVKEGLSQRDRVLKEVATALFSRLPSGISRPADFMLENGTECWVTKYSPPQDYADGNFCYQFEVKFSDGSPLTHLEFFVSCSGWERAFMPVPTKDASIVTKPILN